MSIYECFNISKVLILKPYTYKRRPVTLVFSELFIDINEAIVFEKQVKGWTRKKKEAIINGRWDDLPGLSKNNQDKEKGMSS